MPQPPTELTFAAKAKGFAEVQRQFGKLHNSNQKAVREQLKGTKATQEEVGNLKDRLKDLTEVQTALMKAMSQTGDKGSKAYKELGRELKGVERDATSVNRAISNMEKVIGGADRKAESLGESLEKAMKKGAFLQGAIQGAVPGGSGMFLQRGPGMRRQAAGMAAGRAGRGVVGGAMSTPFGGIDALAGALQSVPGMGFLAAPLRMAGQHAGSALGFQRQMLAAGPGLSGFQNAPITGKMRGKADQAFEGGFMAPVGEKALQGKIGDRVKDVREYMGTEDPGWLAKMGSLGGGVGAEANRHRVNAEAQARRESGGTQAQRDKAENEVRRERGREASQASLRKQQAAPRQKLARQGERMGMTLQEMVGIQSRISQVGGGTGEQIGKQGLGGVAMAAQQRFGIDPSVAGEFLRGGTRGGLQGGKGRAGEAMTEAIKEGMSLGLRGSELNDYMQTVADGISSWQTSGIPFNKEALSSFSAGFSNMGLGAIRGGRVGQGVKQGIQNIGQQGAQTAFGFAAMQRIGGMKSLRPEDVLNARIRMTKMQSEIEGGGTLGKETVNLLKDIVQGAGGVKGFGAGALESVLKELGVQIAPQELKDLTTSLESGGDITSAMFKPKHAGTGPASPEQLIKSAEDFVAKMAPNLKKQAFIANMQLTTGKNMLDTVQAFEESQTKMVKQFSRISPVLEVVADGAVALVDTLPKVIDGFARLALMFSGDENDVPKGIEEAMAGN